MMKGSTRLVLVNRVTQFGYLRYLDRLVPVVSEKTAAVLADTSLAGCCSLFFW